MEIKGGLVNCIEIIKEAGKVLEKGESKKFKRTCWEEGKYLWFNSNGTFMWQDANVCDFRAKDF